MGKMKLDKSLLTRIGGSFICSAIIALALLGPLGKKNSILLFVSVFMTILAISYLNDAKRSILIFIVSLPILVTARKFLYVDFYLFKISLESIYICILFIANASKVFAMIKSAYKKGDKASLNFILYSFAFLILALNSAIFSYDKLSSIRLTFIGVVVPMLFMLCVIVNFKKDQLKYIMYALIIQCSFSSFYGFAQIANLVRKGIPLGSLSSHRMEYTFGYHNVNIYAAIALMVLPFIVDRVLYRENTKNEKIFLLTTGVINVMGILATFTRGAWLMFMLSVAVMLLSKKYRKLLYAGVAVLLLGSKWIFKFIFQRGMGSAVVFIANESTLARIQAALTSIKIMGSYPFGIGFGSYAELYKEFLPAAYYMLPLDFRSKMSVVSYNMEHAHNLFLQIAVELGIVTAIIFIIIIVNRLRVSIKNFSEYKAYVSALLTFFAYSVLTGGQFEHKGIITGTIIMWLLFGMIQIQSQDQTQK